MQFNRHTIAFVFIALCLNALTTEATELRVLAFGAAAPALHRIIPEFERRTGDRVSVWFGPPTPMHAKIKGGEAVDVLFISTRFYDDLLKQGMVEPGFVVVGRFGVGIGIRKGVPKPNLSTTDALKATLLTVKSLG